MLLINERDISFGLICTQKSCLVSFIFWAIASVFCCAVLVDLKVVLVNLGVDLLLYFSSFTFILGKEKLKVYNTHATTHINNITINDFTAVDCSPNIALSNSINGHEIYHQNC
jgi:hypothetical protein